MNKSVQNGVIAGLIGIIFSVISYLFFVETLAGNSGFLKNMLTFLPFIILIYLMVDAGLFSRKMNGGFITFKQVLKPVFVTSVIYAVLTTLFHLLAKYVLFKETYQYIFDKQMDNQYDKMLDLGYSEEMVESSLEMGNNIANKMDLFILPISIILSFFISLIIALILKRTRPDYS